jgi:hypothetical protein
MYYAPSDDGPLEKPVTGGPEARESRRGWKECDDGSSSAVGERVHEGAS